MPDKRKLTRIHRVRTLQLGLVRAEEMRALDRVTSETQLADRIATLAAAVAPSNGAGFSFAASAHYRERLLQSAEAADSRVRTARFQSVQASKNTKAAHRDQVAVEKLIARADADLALRELRDLQNAAPTRKIRHDPC
ncbi:hypothetical protein [Sphingomonas sp.]|uniref:hypothetical protein n=1 Tax=Sphingomonas sp. TaxID=28214 RepID=UPI0035BC0AC0